MIFNVGAGGGSGNAEKIKYDNSTSGLASDNLQGAVDELSESVNNIGTYYDEETETLYIQGGTSNYTYDSETETLYIG